MGILKSITMIPLAGIGFGIGSLLFAGYAYSLHTYSVSGRISPHHSFAYYLLALASLFWSLAAISGNHSFINLSILISNGLILLGSVLLLQALVNKKFILPVAGVLSLILLIVRIVYFFPAAFLSEGILIFNTQLLVSIIYSVLFIGIWLPANVTLGHTIGSLAKVPEFALLLKSLSGLSVIAAVFMLAARTPPVVAGAFIALSLCYLVLIIVNISLAKTKS